MAWVREGLGDDPFGMLPMSNLSVPKGTTATIKSYEQIASYNWLPPDCDPPDRCMVVPGAPPNTVDWDGGKLEADEGFLLMDPDRAFLPEIPLDPIFIAIKTEKPDFDLSKYDLVTDCVNLQKLFAFCHHEDQDIGGFRIDFERIGNLVLATRVESGPFVPIDFESYENAFRATATKATHPITAGPFQQIMGYQFGNINILVRFQSDCVKPQKKKAGESSDKENEDDKLSAEERDKKKLEEAEAIAGRDKRLPFAAGSEIKLVKYGPTPKPKSYQHQLLITHPVGKKGIPSFAWAKLFFSGADNLMVGLYKGSGDFSQKPKAYAIPDVTKLMKTSPYLCLGKVLDCLNKILNFQRKCDASVKTSFVWKAPADHLEIYAREEGGPSRVSAQVRKLIEKGNA